MTTTNEPVQIKLTSYRSLLLAQANGVEIPPKQISLWRREEELVRSATFNIKAYRDCRLDALHFLAPMHALAWEALRVLSDRDPELKKVPAPELLSEMRRLDEVMAGGQAGSIWLAGVFEEDPTEPDFGLSVLAREIRQHYRTKIWASRFGKLAERVKSDASIPELERDFVTAGMDMSYDIEGEGDVRQPLVEMDWNAHEVSLGSLVKTGWRQIDRCAGGGHARGEMMVVGGGTGHGKSYAALGLLNHQGRLGQRAMLFSAEDSLELWWCRGLSQFTEPRCSPADIRTRRADPKVIDQARAKMKANWGKDRIFVHVSKKPTVSEVMETIRLYRYTKQIDMVLVDYLQAIREDVPTTNKVHEVSSVVSKLKRCCDQAGVALVLFSQYSREAYKDGTEPGLNSCKYAGDIENEAEIMALLWKDKEDILRVKVPKVKWARAKELRFTVPICPITGTHGDWQDDFSADES